MFAVSKWEDNIIYRGYFLICSAQQPSVSRNLLSFTCDNLGGKARFNFVMISRTQTKWLTCFAVFSLESFHANTGIAFHLVVQCHAFAVILAGPTATRRLPREKKRPFNSNSSSCKVTKMSTSY